MTSDPGGLLGTLIARLPKYQLHVNVARFEPCIVPFQNDPNELWAFVKLADLESAIAVLVLQNELVALPLAPPQEQERFSHREKQFLAQIERLQASLQELQQGRSEAASPPAQDT